MCGILTAYSKQAAAVDRERFLLALELLGHRGPDFRDVACELDGRLLLAQNVLSICGRPDDAFDHYGSSRSGRFRVVFNGEIYNYRDLHRRFGSRVPLQTGSDAEVLANLFDVMAPVELCQHLDGMYAFVAFDRESGELHIARDTVGEKPLFRYEDSRLVVYASEVRALLAITGPLELDFDTLREYLLTRHFMPATHTEFCGVEKVSAGTLTTYELLNDSTRTHSSHGLAGLVSAERADEYRGTDPDALVAQLDHELATVIEQMLPECAYAAIASGGIDSSLLAWYLAHSAHAPDLVLGLDFAGLDPVSSSRSGFEQRLGQPIEWGAASVDEYTEALAGFYAHHCGLMPTHSLASMDMLASRVAARGIRVLFGGDGADELFAGYAAYATIDDARLINSESSPSPYSCIAKLPVELAGIDIWQRIHSQSGERAQRDWKRARLHYAHVDEPADRSFQAMLLLDSGTQLESVGLASSDRMAMHHSVEARSPFVHRRILRFALNLPRSARLATNVPASMRTKHIVKRVFAARLGAELIYPKQGFPGFPNEAGRQLCGADFRRVSQTLDIPAAALPGLLLDRAMEWKLLNLELFLRHVDAGSVQ